MDNLENKIIICRWKLVANRDEKTLENNGTCITLGKDKPCFKCDGSLDYSDKIQCENYTPKTIFLKK